MRVLVTGATGYVGSRLVPALLAAGHDVVVGARDLEAVDRFAWAEQVGRRFLDVEDTVSVHLAVRDMDAVFYLVHSMGAGEFLKRDREAAHYLAAACEYAGVGRIVYLSGLVPPGRLSDHLRSRQEVEQILVDSAVPTTVLRAAMVIGAGSTSFELMRRVSERLPMTPVPVWMQRDIQPVAVEDVVHLLVRSLEGEPRNRAYDVGGDEVLTYRELLDRFAALAGLERVQLLVPLAPGTLVGEAVAFISGLPRTTVRALVRSLSHDMVCSEDDVRTDLAPGHVFLGIDEAIRRSLAGQTQATEIDGDVQGEAASDPEWVGTTFG